VLVIKHPIRLNSREFCDNKYEHYAWLREHSPVYEGKVSVMRTYLVSRYDDCDSLLEDHRFVRNRTTATGGGRMPFPMPKATALMAQSMIVEDEPAHRRLRGLVHKAFTPSALSRLESRIDRLTYELLDDACGRGSVDLIPAYALPIPVTVIGEMVGVADDEMSSFMKGMRVLTRDFSAWTLARALVWDMPKAAGLVRELVRRKRSDPQELRLRNIPLWHRYERLPVVLA
jgi:cytochrome P450